MLQRQELPGGAARSRSDGRELGEDLAPDDLLALDDSRTGSR